MLAQFPPLFEIKTTPSGVIEGIASSFGGIDSYGDRVQQGAYAATLVEHQMAGTAPAMLWSHRADEPIGRWESLIEAPRGLVVRGQLNMRTTAGREAFEHVRGGSLSGLSVGYSVPPGGDEVRAGIRLLKHISLHEISLVTLPADLGARVTSVKAAADEITLRDLVGEPPENLRDFERLLHQLGYSKTRSAVLAAYGFKAKPSRDDFDPQQLAAVASQLATFQSLLKA